MPASRGRLDL